MIIHQFKSYPGHVWKSNSLTLITDRGLCSSVCGNWQWLTKWLLGASLGLLWPTFVEVDFWEALLLLGKNGSSKMFTAQTLHAEVYANLTICENTSDLKNHPCTVVMNLYKSWVWILWRLTRHPLRLCFTFYFHVSTNWQVYVSGQFKSNYPDLRCNHTAELWLLSLAGNYCCKDIYTCAKFHRGDTVASLGAQISPQNHHWNNKAAHGPTFLLKLC